MRSLQRYRHPAIRTGTPRHADSTHSAAAGGGGTVAPAVPPNPDSARDMYWADKIITEFPAFKRILHEAPIQADWQYIYEQIAYGCGESLYYELRKFCPPPLTRRRRRGTL